MLINADVPVRGARVGVLGLTFKEDCSDLRNSKVPDILNELRQFGVDPLIHDPIASAPEAQHEYGLKLSPLEELRDLDALVLAVSHKKYAELGQEKLLGLVKPGGVVVDVKSAFDPAKVDRGLRYWSL